MIAKTQYISDGNCTETQLHAIATALDSGQQWIQFRFKNTDMANRYYTAEKTKDLCERYKATLIINDYIDIALAVDAAGVHLGLEDASIKDARRALKNKIVGGTAHTLYDIQQRHAEGCDYIGLGPYRFTQTKQQLKPLLGIQGYTELLLQIKALEIQTPILAIGGIQLSDIAPLLNTGVYGIAFSSLLNQSKNKSLTTSLLNQLLYGSL